MKEGVDHDFSMQLKLKRLEEALEEEKESKAKIIEDNASLLIQNEEYIEQITILKYQINMMEMEHQEMLIKQRKICMELQNQNDTLSQMLLIKQRSLTEALSAVDQHTNDLVGTHGLKPFVRTEHSQQISTSSIDDMDDQQRQRKMPRKLKKSMKKPRKKKRKPMNISITRSQDSVLQHLAEKMQGASICGSTSE